MLPYLCAFFLTALSMNQLQKVSSHKNKFAIAFWGSISVLLPSILGGMRSVYLGTDNTRYAPSFARIAQMSTPIEAIEYGENEPGYRLLCYFVSRFTSDYHILCFMTELITMIFIVIGIYFYKDKISMALGILVYLFLQYCNCINLVRQGIALAIVFFAMRYAYEKKIVTYVIFIIIAASFHISALIGLLIYLAFWILDRKHDFIDAVIFCITLFVIVNSFYYIVRILVSLHILTGNYLKYVSPGFHFSFRHSVFCIPVLFVATILYKYLSNKYSNYKYFYLLLWCELIIVQLADTFDPAYRMSLYFNYANIIVLPMLPQAFSKKNRPFAIIIALIYLIAYWAYFVVLNHYGFAYPVYPYITDLF